jgi:hypothetical protein
VQGRGKVDIFERQIGGQDEFMPLWQSDQGGIVADAQLQAGRSIRHFAS